MRKVFRGSIVVGSSTGLSPIASTSLPPIAVPISCSQHDEDANLVHLLRMMFHQAKDLSRGVFRLRDGATQLKRLRIPHDFTVIHPQYWLRNEHKTFLHFEEWLQVVRKIASLQKKQREVNCYQLPESLYLAMGAVEVSFVQVRFHLFDASNQDGITCAQFAALCELLGIYINEDEAIQAFNRHASKKRSEDDAPLMRLQDLVAYLLVTQRGDALSARPSSSSTAIIRILEEFKSLQLDKTYRVTSYDPVALEITAVVRGPSGSIYEAGEWNIHICCQAGYPNIAPTVLILTRILHPSVLGHLDGSGRLLHVDALWSSDWNISSLLQHVSAILVDPSTCYHLLPVHMTSVVDKWLHILVEASSLQHTSAEEFIEFIQKTIQADLQYLPKLDQMHVNVIALFATDKNRFADWVAEYIRRFCSI